MLEVVQDLGITYITIAYKVDGQLYRAPSRTVKDNLQLIVFLIMYADDITLVCGSQLEVATALSQVFVIFQKWGLLVSVPKTKILVVAKTEQELPVVVLDGQQVEVVDKFTCLGSVFTSDNTLDAEISHRLSRAGGAFASLRGVLWHNRRISLRTKCRVFSAVVLTTLLYGADSWAIRQPQLARLEVFQNNCLRALCGVSRLVHTPISVLLSKCGQQSISDKLRGIRLSWLGHLGRLSDDRLPKCMVFGRVEGAKGVGKPRAMWADLLQQDLKSRGINRWFKQCQKRADWRSMCKTDC